MITLTQIAEILENGLNQVYGNPEIKFHIWADVGKYDKPSREGNKITRYIIGNLRSVSSANDANLLVMGTNDLNLEFSIPLKRPRTNAGQNSEELQAIQNGQYPFVQEIKSVFDSYFQEAKSVIISDGQDDYSVSFTAGISVSGVADIQSQLGQNVIASIYIQLYFVKGGTISKDVQVTFNGVLIPYLNVHVSRSNLIERDVYADKLISKGISSSSSFSIDFTFPSNGDNTTQELIDFLLNGKPNTAHFVNVKWGNVDEKLYFMIPDNINTSAQGVTIAGISGSLIEAIGDSKMLSVPEQFQIGRFEFNDTQAAQITFTVSVPCKAFIAGNAYAWENGEHVISLTEENYEYDELTNKFYIYLITDKAVSITSAIPFSITKEAKDG